MADVLPSLIAAGASVSAALIAAFREEIRAWATGRSSSSSDNGTTDAKVTATLITHVPGVAIPFAPTPSIGSAEGRARMRPFDTSIAIFESQSPPAWRIELPRSGKPWGSIAFLVGWLVAWTAGIVMASFAFVGSISSIRLGNQGLGFDIFGTVFVGGWLVGAVAGEIWALRSLKEMLGLFHTSREFWITNQGVVFKRGFGGARQDRLMERENVDGFGCDRGQVFLRYGKERILLPSLTENEAEWLAQELNAALGAAAAW